MDRLNVTTGHALDVGHALAGLGARSYAFIIDWHIRVLLALGWLLLFVVVGWIAGGTPDFGAATPWLVIVPAALIYLGYHPVSEITGNGASPGKRMAGVRVVRADGGDASAAQHLVRNVFRIVDSLPALYCVGIVCALFSRAQLRIGDFAAGTMLVYDRRRPDDLQQAIARYAGAGTRDPALLDLASDLLARWNALEADRREAMARRLLAQCGEPVETLPGSALESRLKALVDHDSN